MAHGQSGAGAPDRTPDVRRPPRADPEASRPTAPMARDALPALFVRRRLLHLVAGTSRAQRDGREHERCERQDDVEREGCRRHARLGALHVQVVVHDRAEDFDPRVEVGAVARELALRDAEPPALRRYERRGGQDACRPEQPEA
eukprot:6559590-Prymnesium_polylepis.1